jgi:molybdate transport system substrate-binding protein
MSRDRTAQTVGNVGRTPMKLSKRLARAMCGAGLATMLGGTASAADLTVITTLNVMPAFQALQHGYETQSGNSIHFTHQPAKPTEALVNSGAPGDAVVGSRSMLERLLANHRLQPGTVVDFASSSLGVFVKAGAARPDIATDARFRAVLLHAASIAYPDPAEGSLGGNYLADLLRRWGILDQLAGKTTLADGGADAGRIVAAGRAQIGINQVAEVQMVPGLAYLSPLPPAVTDKVVMSVAISSQAQQVAAARSWIAYLTSAVAAPTIRADGMKPVHPR